jgi:SAM-dependent methyltransferase
LVERDCFIVDACRGKHVVHLGACDAPFAREKAEKGQLLHQKLREVCAELTGYDKDKRSLDLLANDFAIDDILCRDLSEHTLHFEARADVAVCADIIEHVNNAGHLINACTRLLVPGGTLVLSTANAQSLKQAIRGIAGREPVHPDHVAYYSYATLGVLLQRFQLEMINCRFFCYPATSILTAVLFKFVYTLAPQSADGIVVTARKRKDE